MAEASGWKKIWIVEYRATSGEWFPIDKTFHTMRQSAVTSLRQEKCFLPRFRYRISVYCPKESHG